MSSPVFETHAQRVLRLRKEYAPRRLRYQGPIKALVDRLLLARNDTDNNLSTRELDLLDKELEPLRRIRNRYNKIRFMR